MRVNSGKAGWGSTRNEVPCSASREAPSRHWGWTDCGWPVDGVRSFMWGEDERNVDLAGMECLLGAADQHDAR